MAINRGKSFEKNIQKQFEKLEDTDITRLYDTTMGYINICNPCDFIVYKKPYIIFIECKSTNTSTLNFKSQIRQNQLEGLLSKSNIKGVIAGVLCWFIQYDKTIFIPIQYIDELIKEGKKSFCINNFDTNKVIDLVGTRKKLFFKYDLQKFLNNLFTFYDF